MLSLLGNAHEAICQSNHGSLVTVQTNMVFDEGLEWVTISVSDDGPGIPEPYLERIFEPFFTTKESGSGYGLYLASEILKEMKGRLSVCNSHKGGACFTVWLPVATKEASAAAEAATSRESKAVRP